MALPSASLNARTQDLNRTTYPRQRPVFDARRVDAGYERQGSIDMAGTPVLWLLRMPL
jgi:hypothetical protein